MKTKPIDDRTRLKAIRLSNDNICMLLANRQRLKCFQLCMLKEEILPEDAFIVSVNYEPQYQGWFVVLQSASFEPVMSGTMLTVIETKWDLFAVEIKG